MKATNSMRAKSTFIHNRITLAISESKTIGVDIADCECGMLPTIDSNEDRTLLKCGKCFRLSVVDNEKNDAAWRAIMKWNRENRK